MLLLLPLSRDEAAPLGARESPMPQQADKNIADDIS